MDCDSSVLGILHSAFLCREPSLQVKEWILWWHPEGTDSGCYPTGSIRFPISIRVQMQKQGYEGYQTFGTVNSRFRVLNFDRQSLSIHIRNDTNPELILKSKQLWQSTRRDRQAGNTTPRFHESQHGVMRLNRIHRNQTPTWWSGEGCLKGILPELSLILGCVLTDMRVRWKLTTSMPWIVQAERFVLPGALIPEENWIFLLF